MSTSPSSNHKPDQTSRWLAKASAGAHRKPQAEPTPAHQHTKPNQTKPNNKTTQKNSQYFHLLLTSGNSLASFGRSYLILGLAGPSNASTLPPAPVLAVRAASTAAATLELALALALLPARYARSASGKRWLCVGWAFEEKVSPVAVAVAVSAVVGGVGKRRMAEMVMERVERVDSVIGCVRKRVRVVV
jgi:hypothetical protein